MIARMFQMATSLRKCLQGGKLRSAMRMIFVCVAHILGRVIGWSLLTATFMELPYAAIPLKEVKTHFYSTGKIEFFSRLKIGKKGTGGGGRLIQDAQGVRSIHPNIEVLLRRRA